MQYCSLEHQTLLSSPDTPTTVISALAQLLHSFWSYFINLPQYRIGHLLTWGGGACGYNSFQELYESCQ